MYSTSQTHLSEYISFDFLDKIKEKKTQTLTIFYQTPLTFSDSSSLFELHSVLILLTRVKNTEGQQMLYRNSVKVLKTLSLGIA